MAPPLSQTGQRPRDHGVERGVAPLTIIPNNLLEKSLLSIPSTSGSVGLEALVPKGGILPPGNTDVVSLNWRNFLLVILSFVMLLSQKAERRVNCTR